MKKGIALFILVLVGLTILAGYLIPGTLGPVLNLIINWGILLAGTMGLIGIAYLIRKHVGIILRHEKPNFLSIILLGSSVLTLLYGLIVSIKDPNFIELMLNVQIPVETSLLAVLAVVLLSASFRLVSTRGWNPMTIAFLFSAVVTLILKTGFINFGSDVFPPSLFNFIQRLPLVGARGILIGMALGGLIVGLRILTAADKPYGEK